ncbi:hypothetical protein GCM10027047_34440 [Rhodococcus aerolatus]
MLLLALLTTLAVSPHPPSSASTAPAAARVTTAGPTLLLDGHPWWPAGVNAYQLATDWSVNVGCGAMVDLDAFFAGLPAGSLTRFDAFQSLAVDKYTHQLDPGPIDAVLAAAARHGQLVLPVLSPQDGACASGPFKDRDFYAAGGTQQPGPGEVRVMSFRDWMRYAVDRWRTSPVVAGWELVGEPETSVCGDAACSWPARTCPADAGAVLRSFLDVTGAEVKAIDPAHLVFAGFTGGGQCGTGGQDYQLAAASPGVDVVEYHDYGADGVPLPGDRWNGLAVRLQQAAAVGKPLLVAEVGQLAGSCGTTVDRAASLRTKLSGQQQAGTAGALLWAWVPDPRPGECTYDVGDGDPALGVLDELRHP